MKIEENTIIDMDKAKRRDLLSDMVFLYSTILLLLCVAFLATINAYFLFFSPNFKTSVFFLFITFLISCLYIYCLYLYKI